jgi:hypothetical protein
MEMDILKRTIGGQWTMCSGNPVLNDYGEGPDLVVIVT